MHKNIYATEHQNHLIATLLQYKYFLFINQTLLKINWMDIKCPGIEQLGVVDQRMLNDWKWLEVKWHVH